MTLKNVEDLFLKYIDIQMLQKQILFCYGMSKMTITNENENADGYRTIKFVEFLEMIGRIADLKFQGSEGEGMGLHQ